VLLAVEDYPKTTLEFTDRFRTEEACRQYLFALRWPRAFAVHASADVGENLLPLAHRVASLLKRWLLGTHQGGVQPAHLDYYLDEFTFRFNRRTSRSRGKLFFRLVQQAVMIKPVTGREIRAKGSSP